MDQVYQTALSLASGWVCQKKKKQEQQIKRWEDRNMGVCVLLWLPPVGL